MREHNKLVRDRIPEIIASKGGTADVRVIESDEEYVRELTKKLVEEAREVQEDPGTAELADLKEVLEALAKALNIPREELNRVQKEKETNNGGFNDRIFLISTDD